MSSKAKATEVDAIEDDELGDTNPPLAYPLVRDMVGRLLLIKPLELKEDVESTQPGQDKYDVIVCNVTVLDGGPLHFGGNLADGKPHTHVEATPHAAESVWFGTKGLVSQLRKPLADGKPVLKRLMKEKRTFVLIDATDGDKMVYGKYKESQKNPF